MTIVEARLDLIKSFERALLRYQRLLQENPNSTFYEGLVKNTKEFIEELKQKVAVK